MDEIRKVASAYYYGATPAEKELACQYFRSLDRNGDGRVSLTEYRSLVNPKFSNDQFFQLLDENGDGTLDFFEVLTLFYVEKVHIIACDGCGCLILSTSYFSCLKCQTNYPRTYDLCCSCYGARRFATHHHSSDNFVDSRVLLQLMGKFMNHATISNQPQNNLALEPAAQYMNGVGHQPAFSQARSDQRGIGQAFMAFMQLSNGITVSNAIVNIAEIACDVGCCIM